MVDSWNLGLSGRRVIGRWLRGTVQARGGGTASQDTDRYPLISLSDTDKTIYR